MLARPDRTETAEYYFTYIDKVGDGDIRDLLEVQSAQVLAILRDITADRSLHRYAPGKWSIRELLAHVNDTERVFVFRAFWFARGFDTPLPSFDQNVAASASGAHERSWDSHIQEFTAIRAASLSLFRNLPEEAWMRRGIASGNPFTVRALAYATVGHVVHHLGILRERYL